MTTLWLADAGATERLGAALAATRPAHAVVHLLGDLGAGKSTLARALLRALGVRLSVQQAAKFAPVAGQVASAALSGRPVSTQDFQELLTRFGADDAQKAQLTAGFDANKDGSITQDEFLKGLAKTKGAQAGSDFSQAVMQLMDRSGNADGSVADKEFAAFSTAFAATGAKRAGVA